MTDTRAEMDEWLNTAPVGARRRWNALYDVVIEDYAGMRLIGMEYVGPRPPDFFTGCQRCAAESWLDWFYSLFDPRITRP